MVSMPPPEVMRSITLPNLHSPSHPFGQRIPPIQGIDQWHEWASWLRDRGIKHP